MSWLTQECALDEGKKKVEELIAFVASRGNVVLERNDADDIARSLNDVYRASATPRSEWFFASVGIMDVLDEDGKQTFYLTRSPTCYVFAQLNVVPWTNWLGSVYAAISECIRRGFYPESLIYGPDSRKSERDLGPLINYQFDHGLLVKADYYAAGMELARPAVAAQSPEGTFGLRDIIRSIDTEQDKKLRATMSGVFILTGGPGVGKTTVALHRLSYLINEQNAEGAKTINHYTSRDTLFFTPESMAVVVWKDHLVPYLDSCVRDLGLDGVRVQHIEDWVAQSLRPYVPFGLKKGQFQLFADPDEIKELKLRCSEEDVAKYLMSEHKLWNELRDRYKVLHTEVNQWLEQAGDARDSTDPVTTKLIPPAYFAVDEVEASFRSMAASIDVELARLKQTLDSYSAQTKWRTVQPIYNYGIELRDRIVGRLSQEKNRIRTSAVRLLMGYYESQEYLIAAQAQGKAIDHQQLIAYVRRQYDKAQLSHADRYLLLWIIRIMSARECSDNDALAPLKEYSHVVVDEAQYYHPLLLRLLYELTKEPRKSMTIVGDLEQRISSDGGLITWEGAGIAVPEGNLQRLDTNYRWSKQVFGFLTQFRRAAGLRDSLRPPDVWYSQEGLRPDVVESETRDKECLALAQRINQLKADVESMRWSIAVVLPLGERHDAVQGLIALFERCDIRSRWASGQDLRESKDHVVLTTYDSVVGLEFDAVMLPGVDLVLKRSQRDEAMRALWVAVTRARRYEWISGLAADPHWSSLFGKEELHQYRRTADAFLE